VIFYLHKRIVYRCVDPAANSNKTLPASANLNFFEFFHISRLLRAGVRILYTLVAGCLHLVLLCARTLRERKRERGSKLNEA
jgi:hypothetical protein